MPKIVNIGGNTFNVYGDVEFIRNLYSRLCEQKVFAVYVEYFIQITGERTKIENYVKTVLKD